VFICVLLSIISCSFATYYYSISTYSSSTCSGTPLVAQYTSKSSDGLCFDVQNMYSKYTCEGDTGLNLVENCQNSDCSNCVLNATYPPCNSTQELDGYYTGSSCGTTPPTIPAGLVQFTAFGTSDCSGSSLGTIVFSQTCMTFGSSYQKYECSGSTPNEYSCSDSACSHCTVQTLPTSCTFQVEYSCTSTGITLYVGFSLMIIMLAMF